MNEFNVTIKIKIGNMEVEVNGPKAWCEKTIKKIIEWYKDKEGKDE